QGGLRHGLAPATPRPISHRTGLADCLREDPLIVRRTFLADTGAMLLAAPLAAVAQESSTASQGPAAISRGHSSSTRSSFQNASSFSKRWYRIFQRSRSFERMSRLRCSLRYSIGTIN